MMKFVAFVTVLAVISICARSGAAKCEGERPLPGFECVDPHWTSRGSVTLQKAQRQTFKVGLHEIVGDLTLMDSSVLELGTSLIVSGSCYVAAGVTVFVDAANSGHLTCGDITLNSTSTFRVTCYHPSKLVEPSEIEDIPGVIVAATARLAGKLEVIVDGSKGAIDYPLIYSVIGYGGVQGTFKSYSASLQNQGRVVEVLEISPIYSGVTIEVNLTDAAFRNRKPDGPRTFEVSFKGLVALGIVVLVVGVAIFVAVFIITYRRAKKAAEEEVAASQSDELERLNINLEDDDDDSLGEAPQPRKKGGQVDDPSGRL